MARFQFHRRPLRLFASRRAPRLLERVPAPVDEITSRGPGWFESSWELGRGLAVHEGLPGHAGLEEWLGAYLCELTVPIGPKAAGQGALRRRD